MKPSIALITGAGRGIGRATALALKQAGYDLLLTARTKRDLDQTAELAGGATILAGDVSSPAHVKRLIVRAASLGKLEVIVNNAGYAPALSIEQMSLAEWDKILAVNLSAMVYVCKFAWPVLVKQKGGVIINISSMASRDPFAGLGPYGAAKAGVNIFSLDLARQGKAHGIRVHTIAPGAVETSMLRKLLSPKELPTNQIMRPEDIAEAIVACVNGALKHTSGEVIYLRK
ncbi:MAG TPA: SDR family oxidoreductase [Tepidisphaeraceae bacterium]|jgi:3-oxoacyl-[acyl-carrier protein] reductase